MIESNYMSDEELSEVLYVIRSLNGCKSQNLNFRCNIFDVNGDPMGRIEFLDGDYVFVLGDK